MMHMIPGRRGLVAVRADVSDPKTLLAELHTAFETWKAEVNANIEALKKGQADPTQTETMERINSELSTLQKAMDDLNARLAAQALGAGSGRQRTQAELEYEQAFRSYFKSGDIQAALSVGSAPDGGYTAPIEWDRTIVDALKIISPMRQLAQVQTHSGAGFTRLINDRSVGSGWVGETAPRPQTSTPRLTPLTFTPGEIYAMPAATQQILDDSEIDVEAWLADEVETEFARQESIAFVTGDGVNKPFGLLAHATGGVAAARHPWGTIPDVPAVTPGTLGPEDIVNLIYDLPQELSANARFLVNRNTIARVRLLRDDSGQFLWQPSMQAGQPATLMGYPLTEDANMPDVAAGARPIAFGDFRRGYLIIDRTGIRVLRDPYSNKPYIMFYTTRRVGGGVQDPTVLRFLLT